MGWDSQLVRTSSPFDILGRITNQPRSIFVAVQLYDRYVFQIFYPSFS